LTKSEVTDRKPICDMGCSSCSNNSSGLPNGCKNNGACGVSGCNKLDVFDWLAGMQLPDNQKPYDVVEMRFKNRKAFYRNAEGLELQIGDVVAVEASPGHDIGVVSLTGELVKMQMQRKGVKDNLEIKKIYRKARQEDIEKWQAARGLEKETLTRAREIVGEVGLDMKLSDIEFQGDKTKATFYYTADDRVDFRELIRRFAEAFKIRIEMRQIGMRQEAGRLGGIGSCGRELCCSTWLSDFRSVSTSAARYQQLSLNPQKLAGQCGKLKCCLNYELDQYIEATTEFPSGNTRLETEKGRLLHFKTDIFKRVMYFIIEGEFGASPVAIGLAEVLEIMEMNKKGIKPGSFEEFVIEEESEEDEIYANVVGQDSLTRFDRKKKARRKPDNRNKARQGGDRQREARTEDGPKPVAEGGNKPDNMGDRKPQGQRPQGQRPPGPKPEGDRQPRSENPRSEGDRQPREGGKRRNDRRRNGPKGPRPDAQPNKE
jgi:cell fate regulator YaaT (PSP1 superfamily)